MSYWSYNVEQRRVHTGLGLWKATVWIISPETIL